MPNKQVLPRIQLPSPILSLAGDGQGGVWAGGTGGVAHFNPDQGWTPMISGLPLSGVSGLVAGEKWLFAGGVEGIARYALNGVPAASGWQLCEIEGKGSSIAALALSPDFAQDQAALAASLESGIFRSEDAGRSWHGSNFGLLNFEVTALAWSSSGQAFAGTAGGVYRSPNGGRAWRAADDTFGIAIAALVMLSDSRILAVSDDGRLLVSEDNGSSWQTQASNLPDGIVPTICTIHGELLLLGSSNAGLFASSDGGHGWQAIVPETILALGASGSVLYAGTGRGLIGSSDGGQSWEALPFSPLHDLRQITVVQGQVIVSGGYSVALRARDDQSWEPLLQVPMPLSLMMADRTGRLFASGPDGLFVSDDAGDSWQQVLAGEQGHVGHLALRDDGKGWGASADSKRLLRTTDGGLHWELANSPLGADRVVALQATALEAAGDLLFAATYSPNQQIARLWYSLDGGLKWNRGAEARTIWAGVATYHQPPMVSLGNTILAQAADESWQPAQLPGDTGLVRRIIGHDGLILALTTNGILFSEDNAASFAPLEGVDLPTDQIMDIALDGERLYVLSVDGLVCIFEL
ncbi:MAG: hypothetical protein ABI835_16025 [Chloroflexota bacterium]